MDEKITVRSWPHPCPQCGGAVRSAAQEEVETKKPVSEDYSCRDCGKNFTEQELQAAIHGVGG